MNILSRNVNNRILIYILTIFLFACCIVITYGVKESLNRYYVMSIESYNDSQWNLFYSNYKSAIRLGKFGMINSSYKIQQEIKQELDMDQLKDSLTYNRYYEDFDMLLRRTLQTNVFTVNSAMDQNRNSVFVLCNGKIVSDYSHQLRGTPFIDGDFKKDNDIKEYIESDFYNVDLSSHALSMIENQSEGFIVWQKEKPSNPNAKKYSRFNVNTLREIYETEGIDGFDSYTVLIPEYITEYGNIFGEFDTSQTAGRNNKIIIVQKLNLKDYFSIFLPVNISDTNELDDLYTQYDHVKIMTYIFEIILYISILSYVVIVIFSINKIIESSDEQNIKEDKEKEDTKENIK